MRGTAPAVRNATRLGSRRLGGRDGQNVLTAAMLPSLPALMGLIGERMSLIISRNQCCDVSKGLPPRIRSNSMALRAPFLSSSWPMTPDTRLKAHSTARSVQLLIRLRSLWLGAAERPK